MKKLFSVFLAALLIVSCAAAEDIDLSALTFTELAALRDRCQYEMMQRDEWQEVTVPPGVYKVGEDIPAGTWSVHCSEANTGSYALKEATIEWGDYLRDNGQSIAWSGTWDRHTLFSKTSSQYVDFNYVYTFTVHDGQYIVISFGYNAVVFTPDAGKTGFSFK